MNQTIKFHDEGSQFSKLNILNANVRCLNSHFVELEAFLANENIKPSIIGATETWLNDSSDLKKFDLKGYHELIACNRSFSEKGGVALWLDKNFSYRVALNDTVREWLLVEILSPIKQFVGVTYRCHMEVKEPKYLEWLAEECLRVCENGRNIIIMGGFNIDLLKQTKYSIQLLDIISSHALKLVSPLDITRQQTDSKSCIDHIYSNLPVSTRKVYHSTITDHFFVWTKFETLLMFPKTRVRIEITRTLNANNADTFSC